MKWEEKLNKFIDSFEYIDDVVGILVCGSYITGNPTKHSDLDVHLLLNDKVKYRVRGNKIVDGLLIEYFANPKSQIKKYFKEDYKNVRPMSHTQFITGKIIMDKTGDLKKLKEEAKKMLKKNYEDINTSISDIDKYTMWDMLDDLKDIYETKREDFDFIYYCNLDRLLGIYMKHIKYPYNKKTILGNIISDTVRKKYLLKELPDYEIQELIEYCITVKSKESKMRCYKKLTEKIFDLVGGFSIDNFKYKSNIEK